MLTLSISQKSIDNLNKELLLKLAGVKQLTSQSTINEISNAAFTILGKRFMIATDTYSSMNPKKMHHIYEWRQIGSPRARLFILERGPMISGNIIFSTKFLPSRTPVPVPAELLMPGRNGKSVTTKTIFKEKASVMENGKPVTFEAKKTLAFLGKQGINFIQKGSVVNIPNPGGVGVKNSLQSFMSSWYTANAQSIMDSSGLYEKIVQEVAICLEANGAGPLDVKKTIEMVVRSITKNMGVIV